MKRHDPVITSTERAKKENPAKSKTRKKTMQFFRYSLLSSALFLAAGTASALTINLPILGGSGTNVTLLQGSTILDVNTLGGAVNVDVGSGTVLTGSGTTASNITVTGTILPGVGGLTVGNALLNPGANLAIVLGPNGQPLGILNATGHVTLDGGLVSLLGSTLGSTGLLPGSFNVITTLGGITGTLGVANTLPFLTLGTQVVGNNLVLTVNRNGTSFSSVAGNGNQAGAAGAAEELGLGNPVFNAIVGLSSIDFAQQAFAALSGEAHASLASEFVSQTSYARDTVLDNMYAAFSDPIPPCTCYTGLRVWAQGIGSWGELEGNDTASEVESRTGGLFVGADQAINDNLRVGALVGYTHGDVDVDDLDSHSENANYTAGIYAGTHIDFFRFTLGATYTWSDINANRNVVFPGFFNHLSSDYNASTSQAFAEAGVPVNWFSLNLEPYVNGSYVNLHMQSFTENGGPAALTGNEDVQDTFFSTLGVRQAATVYQTEEYSVGEKVRVGWQHAYDDITPTSTLAFASGGPAFSVTGAPIAKNSAVVDAGVNVDNEYHTVQVALNYVSQWAHDARDNGVTGTLTWQIPS